MADDVSSVKNFETSDLEVSNLKIFELEVELGEASIEIT